MTNPTRYYSSTASKTTLALAISSTDLSLQLSAASNLPILYPYTLILEKDTANEEVVQVNSLVGTSYQITRNIDSSGAKAHAIGAAVEHGVSARDFTESRSHEAAAIAHDTTSAIVGKDDVQTLTNKTLGASSALSANLAAGGFKITGLGTPTLSTDAATKGYIDTGVNSAAASAAAALISQNAAASSAIAANSSAIASASSQVISTAAASTATASASTATTSAGQAVISASSASTSAASALTSQTSATASASAALISQNAAATSATSASNSATTAAASVATITASAAQASTSASSSLTSQQSAAISASSAATSASSAATSLASVVGTTGAGIVRDMGSIADPDTTTGTYVSIATLTDTATTSAGQAATSAASAATSASSALTSQTSAATSATSASTSASSALTSANSAAASAVQAATIVAGAIQGTLINAKGDLLAGSADDVVARVAVGANGYVLTASSTSSTGLIWAEPSIASDWGTL
jgi:hypothetical protein